MSPRAPTHGDRNEGNAHIKTPPRGVGLTEPPIYELGVPHEVGFEDTSQIDDPSVRHDVRIERSGGDTDQRLHFVEESVHDLRGDFREHRAEFRGLRKDVGELLKIEQTKRVAAIEIDAARAKDDIAKSASIRDARLKLVLWLVTGGLGWWLISHLIGAR